jgi:hypothetical protein
MMFEEINDQGVGAMHGGMQVISPQIPTPMPNVARQPQIRGGAPRAKQAPTFTPPPVIPPPTIPKQAAQANGPELAGINSAKMTIMLSRPHLKLFWII